MVPGSKCYGCLVPDVRSELYEMRVNFAEFVRNLHWQDMWSHCLRAGSVSIAVVVCLLGDICLACGLRCCSESQSVSQSVKDW